MAPQKHAAEPQTIVIGSKHNVSGNSAGAAASQRRAPRPRAATVHMHIEGVGIKGVGVREVDLGEWPLRMLTRFSIVASNAFPRQQTSANADGEQVDRITNAVRDRENAGLVEDGNIDIPTAVTAPGGMNPTPAALQAPQLAEIKVLNVFNEDLEAQPPEWAFDYAFNWMRDAQPTPRNAKPPSYYPVNPEDEPLPYLIDILAVAETSLGIRPYPYELREHIYNRLSVRPPQVQDITYVGLHLSSESRVIQRCITSYLQKLERDPSPYSKEDEHALEEFMTGADEFAFKFVEIKKDRAQKGTRGGYGAAGRGRDSNGQGGRGRGGYGYGGSGRGGHGQGNAGRGGRGNGRGGNRGRRRGGAARGGQGQGSRAQETTLGDYMSN